MTSSESAARTTATKRKKPKAAPERNGKGNYPTPQGSFRSVTTQIRGGVPKPGLVPWAARTVAQCAIDNLPRLAKVRGRAARQETFEWLSSAAEHKRDMAGDLGTAVHKAIEASVLDKPAPEPTDEQQPYLAAFAAFVQEWQPIWEATELVVAHPEHGWAGKADWWAWLPALGAMVLGDTKTGSVYGEAALQLAAYQRATVGWLPDGTEVTPPAASRACVLHLRPQADYPRGYALIPIDTSDAVYQKFRAAQQVDEFTTRMAKQVIGGPLATPTQEG